MKKMLALILTLAMLLTAFVVPAASAEGKGKILYLSNLNSGAQYEFYVAYLNMMAKELGYTVEIVPADGFNDPAGNLKNVKNAYTSDVVGLIATQDGGLINIMEEYPDLWVVGFFSDFDAVFNEGATSAGVLEKDHFLGLMGDNFISGEALGEAYRGRRRFPGLYREAQRDRRGTHRNRGRRHRAELLSPGHLQLLLRRRP